MRYRKLFCLLIVSTCSIYGLYTIRSETPPSDIPSQTDGRALRQNVTNSSDEKCQNRLPQCIIIGLARSGTSTLITFLNYHPQIAVNFGPPKEKNFFNYYYEKGLDWYRQQMACSYWDQITMEKSPMYFRCLECPKRIYEMDRDIKLLLIVKDPITRTVSSAIKHLIERHSRNETEYGTIEELLVRPNSGRELALHRDCLSYSNYTHHLRNWLVYFNMDKIHVVDGHAFENNPASELRGVEKFLGIEPFFKEDQFVFNITKDKHCFKQAEQIECMQEGKGTLHPELSPEITKILKEHFHPMNEEFYHLIGRRFDWGY